jgi:formylglycine-generating enzyme required for sulfatase activity
MVVRSALNRRLTALGWLFPMIGMAQAETPSPGIGYQDCDACPELVTIAPGGVLSGDPYDYEKTEDDQAKRPKIVISRPFAMGKYEVTQKEWEALMGDNPSDVKAANLPVVRVSWRRVQEFIARLNAKTGKTFRLPTDEEWEYAARAGHSGKFGFGDDETQMGQYAWYKDNSGLKIQPVGKLKPSAFGLYDMHGNVWEWTADCSGSNYAPNLPKDYVNEWQNFCYRIIRGGSVENYPKLMTAFYKTQLTPVNFSTNLGFRLARTLP